MDPNAALKELRELTKGCHEEVTDLLVLGTFEVRARRVVELFEYLDEWITKGGFLPADWRKT